MRKKIDITGYPTELEKAPHFFQIYEENFAHLVDLDIRLLELGINKGQSLVIWRDYFEKARIVGLDVNPVHIEDPTGRIRAYVGYQQDKTILDRIAKEEAPGGFDVIIDDCSHIAEFTRISFWHLFVNHLKPGGIYAIEDINTGYIEDWVDGRSYKRPLLTAESPTVRSRNLRHVQGYAGESVIQSWARFARRSTPDSIVQLVLHSQRFGGLYQSLHKATRSHKSKRRIPSHMYGMIGFAKELIDMCALGDSVNGAKIERIHVSLNHLIIVKSQQ